MNGTVNGSADEPARLRPGDRIVRRFLHPHQGFTTSVPQTVVRDDAAGLVSWLAPGTTVTWATLADGRDIRSLPVAERFLAPWRPATRAWHGQGTLMITPVSAPWTVWVRWTDDWRFEGWYVNLERPHLRQGQEIVTMDHVLDIQVAPDGSWAWKDDDELDAAVDAGWFTADQAVGIRSDGQAAVVLIEQRASPFSDGWEDWRPGRSHRGHPAEPAGSG